MHQKKRLDTELTAYAELVDPPPPILAFVADINESGISTRVIVEEPPREKEFTNSAEENCELPPTES